MIVELLRNFRAQRRVSFGDAFGQNALTSTVSGSANNGFGTGAMYSNHGNFNTAIGDFALTLNDTATKTLPSTEPRSWRILAVRLTRPIGDFACDAQTTASRNVYIGALVGEIAGESDHTYIRHISSTTVNGETVTVERVTQLLGHASSSRRYKEHIKPMDKASDALYRLKPVTFRL